MGDSVSPGVGTDHAGQWSLQGGANSWRIYQMDLPLVRCWLVARHLPCEGSSRGRVIFPSYAWSYRW